MKIDGGLITDLAAVPDRVRDLEDLGYHGAVSVETAAPSPSRPATTPSCPWRWRPSTVRAWT
jgi:hypothetical protein